MIRRLSGKAELPLLVQGQVRGDAGGGGIEGVGKGTEHRRRGVKSEKKGRGKGEMRGTGVRRGCRRGLDRNRKRENKRKWMNRE